MIYIRILLLLLVIGSLGGYECGNATFLQAFFNALVFSGAFIISLIPKRAQKSAARKRQLRTAKKYLRTITRLL